MAKFTEATSARLDRALSFLGWAFLPAALCLLVLYPVSMLVMGSFSDAPPGENGSFTLANYQALFSDGSLARLTFNTFRIAILSTAGASIAGVFMAWLVTRTDIGAKRLIEIIAILPFLTPASLLAIGWAIMGNPDVGLLNKLWWGIVGGDNPLFDLYTYTGVAFVMALHPAGFVFLMSVAPFRNLDPDLENAARMSGASEWSIFTRIQIPLLSVALLPTIVYTGVRAFEAFEIPVILGTPARVMVFTNEIYYRLKILTPPNYGWSFAVACILTFVFGLVLLALQSRRGSRRFVTITGKGYRPQLVRLGRMRWLCIGLVTIYALLTSVLPLGVIVVSSFFPSFGIFDIASITFGNYTGVLGDPSFRRAIGNTMLLIFIAGSACVFASTIVAYVLKRRLTRWRGPVSAILAVPWAMPGLVLGLAMLWAYIRIPGMYGSLWGVGAALFTLGLSVAIASVSANLEQLGPELEESSLVHGASTVQTFRRILLPLLWPGMVAAWFVLASMFSRELAMASLLYGPGSEVLSVVLLRYWELGRGNYVAVVSVVFIILIVVLFVAERLLARRSNLLA
jgi:iron(III) transport system permease protein